MPQPHLWICDNCAIEFAWHPVYADGQIFCCAGCAAGGPCSCDYDAMPASTLELETPTLGKRSSEAKHSAGGSNMASKIRPIGDRVVVKPTSKEEVSKSGIIIPDTAKEKPQEGVVVAVGSGKLQDNGDRTPLEVKVGDRVLFAKYGGTEFKYDGDDLLVLRESDILAILSE
jgi:chaperonin GroES